MLWGPVPSTEPLLPLSLAGCRSPLLTANCPSAPPFPPGLVLWGRKEPGSTRPTKAPGAVK